MAGFELIPWIKGEVLGVAFSDAWRRLLGSRAKVAQEILVEELERGNARIEDVADCDEAAAMVFEYAEAAKRGAARRNLRLIAQIMTKSFNQAPPLYADDFLRWSTLLASLSREELIVAAVMHRYWSHPMANSSPGNTALAVKTELIGPGKLFTEESDYEATVSALTRTGLVIFVAAYGTAYFRATTRLEKLATMARLEEAAIE